MHGLLQAEILERAARPFSGDRPDPGLDPGSPALQAVPYQLRPREALRFLGSLKALRRAHGFLEVSKTTRDEREQNEPNVTGAESFCASKGTIRKGKRRVNPKTQGSAEADGQVPRRPRTALARHVPGGRILTGEPPGGGSQGGVSPELRTTVSWQLVATAEPGSERAFSAFRCWEADVQSWFQA